MKQLILVRGLSGSGKTLLASTICGDAENRFMISADDFFVDDQGEYRFNGDKLKEAHTWCQEETKEAMEDDFEVIVVHNTFTRKWEVDPYLELAEKLGYAVQVINLYDGGLSDRELSQRCVHNIPAHVIQKQRKRWDKDVYRERRPQPMYHAPHPYYHPPHPYYPNQGRYPKHNSRR